MILAKSSPPDTLRIYRACLWRKIMFLDFQIAKVIVYGAIVVMGAIFGFQLNKTGDTEVTTPVYIAGSFFFAGILMLVPMGVVAEENFSFIAYVCVMILVGAILTIMATSLWYLFFKWFYRFIKWYGDTFPP